MKAKPFSVAVGCSPALIGLMERGVTKQPELETLRRIAKACDVSESWLVLGIGDLPTDETVRAAPAIKAATSTDDADPTPTEHPVTEAA